MFDWLLQNSGLASLIAFGLVLVPVIIVHELGHLIAGKSVGITILEFGIGFPPKLGRIFMWRGTEFTINLLPIGGFVRPLGEDFVRPQEDNADNIDYREAVERGVGNIQSVSDVSPISRIIFFSAGAIANLITAFLLFIAIGMFGIPGVRLHVIHVSEDSALYAAGLRNNDAIESVNGELFVDTADFSDLIAADSQVDEIAIRRGEEGDLLNLTYDNTIEIITSQQILSRVYVTGIALNSPADRAGVMPGDVILAFNDKSLTSIQQLIDITGANLGQTVQLTLLRNSEMISLSLVPRENPPQGEGAMGIEINSVLEDSSFGFIYRPLAQQVVVPLTLWDSVIYSVNRFSALVRDIFAIPAQIVQGNISAGEARPVSVVGISQMGGVFLQRSIEEERPVVILNYMAVISIALGLTNLLPLPALDGGRILFVMLELVRGKPIAQQRESIVHLLGLVFLLSLTVIIVINDIINPITDLIP